MSGVGAAVGVGGRGGAVRAYDIAAAKLLRKADLHKAYVSDIDISPDGTRLYVAGDAGLVVAGTDDFERIEPALTGPEKPVFCAAVSDDGMWIVAGDSDSGLWLWRKDTAKPYWSSTTAHAGPIHCAMMTPDMAAEPPSEGEGDGAGGGDDAPPVVPDDGAGDDSADGPEDGPPDAPPDGPDGD